MAKPEVLEAVHQYVQNNDTCCVADFVIQNVDFIKQNTPQNKTYSKFWTTLIQKEAVKLNKLLIKSKVNWKSLFETTTSSNSKHDNNNRPTTTGVASTANNNNINSHPATSSSSTPSSAEGASPRITTSTTASAGSKRSRSNSSKYDSVEMTDTMKNEYKASYEAMEQGDKWKLEDGTYVEDLLYHYGCRLDYEHLVHSWIIDLEDQCWKTVFTKEQINEIKTKNSQSLPELDSKVNKLFNDLSNILKEAKNKKESSSSPESPMTTLEEEEIIDSMFSLITKNGIANPRTESDLYWLQMTLLSVLDLYRWRIINWIESQGSEMDFITRIWTLLDRSFDSIMVQTRRDQTSISATAANNKNRNITGLAPIDSKATVERPDLALYRFGMEFGAAECGKDDEAGIGKKILKAMLLFIGKKCDNNLKVLRSLNIVGFTHFHLGMRMYLLDNPNGFVCRIQSTEQYEISTTPSLMSTGLFQLLKLTLKSKQTVQNSIKVVNDYMQNKKDEDPDLISRKDSENTILVHPPLLSVSDKKQKKK